MGIQLVRGRTFTGRDVGNGAPVVLINEAPARQFVPGEDPLGRRLRGWRISKRERRIAEYGMGAGQSIPVDGLKEKALIQDI